MNSFDDALIRHCDPQRDAPRLLALDVSYESPGCLVAISRVGGLKLVPQRSREMIRYKFPFQPSDTQLQPAWVAEMGEQLIGFIAVKLEAWNRRLTICHFYVDGCARRRGVGRRLMQAALIYGVSAGAKVAWAETSNCNLPGIDAYKQLGFHLCGFDAPLYCGTESEGQFPVFMARVLAKNTCLPLQIDP